MASGQDIDAVEAVVTETSPLLARDAPTADVINGEAGPDGTTAPEASQDGNPEMLKKMHILIPAVGVGVSPLAMRPPRGPDSPSRSSSPP